MDNIEMVDLSESKAKVGDLLYGTVLHFPPIHPDSIIYMKVDKRKLGHGLSLTFQGHSSVILINLKTGMLRAVPVDKIAVVFDEHLKLQNTKDIREHLKEMYVPHEDGD